MPAADNLSLGEALRALPLAAPPGDNWAVLAERLPRARATPSRRHRLVLPAALAAACAVAFVVVQRTHAPADTATVAHVAASSSTNGTDAQTVSSEAESTRLAQLQQRSAALERWLRDTGRNAAPLQGQDLAAATEIENLIGLVDVELAAPRQTQAQALWQRRVGLLEDLTALRYSNYRLAAGGEVAAAYSID